MAKKSQDKNWNNYMKKDTNNLFTGGYKSTEFADKEDKLERDKMSTKDWLDYAELNEIVEDDEG